MLSMGAEIDQRIWATNHAWGELYGMCWNKKVHGLLGRTRPHKDSQLSPSVEKVAAGALLHASSVHKGSDGTRALPESPHIMHIFHVVGLAECTSNRTTHSLRAFVCILRQMVMRSDYWQICRRWLSSLSGPSRSQTLSWSLVTSSVWGAN